MATGILASKEERSKEAWVLSRQARGQARFLCCKQETPSAWGGGGSATLSRAGRC